MAGFKHGRCDAIRDISAHPNLPRVLALDAEDEAIAARLVALNAERHRLLTEAWKQSPSLTRKQAEAFREERATTQEPKA